MSTSTRRSGGWGRALRRALPLALALSIFAGSCAGASGRFQSFDNGRLGDCAYESFANLVLAEFPSAHVDTPEVTSAWRAWGPSNAAGYALTTGFSGHRAASLTPVSQGRVPYAAAHGGVWVWLSWGHAVMIDAATRTKVYSVDDGMGLWLTWPQWSAYYFTPGSTYYAVAWAQPGTVAVTYSGSYETDAMTTQVARVGSTITLEPLGMVNAGYTFEGWATSQDSNVVAYQPGQSVKLTSGLTLYAVWTLA